jgi:[acyl-carrier-protein] S-malonyltransferase
MGADLRALTAKGPPKVLAETRIAQPAIFTMEYAVAMLLIEHDIAPSMVAGHSLGQFAAVAVAGSLDFAAALGLVIERGRLMQENNQRIDGGMIAVDGLAADAIERAIAELGAEVWIANVNAPTQCVISGLRPGLREVKRALDALGGNCRWLDIAVPGHTPLMKTEAQPLAQCIDAATFRDANVPVLASVGAAPLTDAAAVRAELRGHMLGPIHWAVTLRRIRDARCRFMIECGPERVLKGLALRNNLPARCLTTSTVVEFEDTCRSIEEATCASP